VERQYISNIIKPGKAHVAVRQLLAASFITLILIIVMIRSAHAEKQIRLGYVGHFSSALCVVADQEGYFKSEGIEVRIVRFDNAEAGIAALERGDIDAGSFHVGMVLRRIAAGARIRIIAGGGIPTPGAQQAGEPASLALDGGVVVIPETTQAEDKGSLVCLVAALIRAYIDIEHQPERYESQIHEGARKTDVITYNPNPDYWQLERIWRTLGLQPAGKPRDFFANHVYEEVYCDALDRILVRYELSDPALKKLFSQAVCTPNCCPANSGKIFK
jgi:hypothetical protein